MPSCTSSLRERTATGLLAVVLHITLLCGFSPKRETDERGTMISETVISALLPKTKAIRRMHQYDQVYSRAMHPRNYVDMLQEKYNTEKRKRWLGHSSRYRRPWENGTQHVAQVSLAFLQCLCPILHPFAQQESTTRTPPPPSLSTRLCTGMRNSKQLRYHAPKGSMSGRSLWFSSGLFFLLPLFLCVFLVFFVFPPYPFSRPLNTVETRGI